MTTLGSQLAPGRYAVRFADPRLRSATERRVFSTLAINE